MQPQKNKNLTALGIGFGLIILITILTIWRPFSKKAAPNNVNSSQISQAIKDIKQISTDELLKKINGNEALSLIDVRSNDEFVKEHILDSTNMPADSFNQNSAVFDNNNAYVVIDDGINYLGIPLANKLASGKKLEKVYYLTGGFLAWKNKLNPVIGTGDPNSFVDQSKVTYINSDKLNEIMKSKNNLYIIDVRKGNAYAEGHIRSAVNVFLDDLEKKRQEIPLGKKIVLYDNDGFWAFQGAVRLFDMGILNVYTLSDGFNAWKQKKFEVVK